MLSSSGRSQMVSPVTEDVTEDKQKAARAGEAQASVEQELLSADQTQILSKVGSTFFLSEKHKFGCVWIDWN